MKIDQNQLIYLKLLSNQYPTLQSVSTAIIQIQAQLDLPKATEHFLSDVHGEYEAFQHVLHHASGLIRRKIENAFGDSLTQQEKRSFGTLIYYPKQKLPLVLQTVDDKHTWYYETIGRLIRVGRGMASKYSRAWVQQTLPPVWGSILNELLYEQEHIENKKNYYQSLLNSVISTGSAQSIIVELAQLIQRLAIAHLHIVGDIYDRGPGAHLIMDRLMEYHSIDIQWGNHDILWMGAAVGGEPCIANTIRMCLRYGIVDTLQHYRISLLPLISLAMDSYGDDPCDIFFPKLPKNQKADENEKALMAKMHKAITILQFKLEGQLIQKCPQFEMDGELLLDKIDYDQGTIQIRGQSYPLTDTHFPTINPDSPYELSEKEQEVIEKLKLNFTTSEPLQKHVRFLYSHGSIYCSYNGNLLYHGCIPMLEDGSFQEAEVEGKTVSGRALLDRFDYFARQAYFETDDLDLKQKGVDMLWYLWCGANSPLFGKHKMATFERHFIADPSTHEERRNPYYRLRNEYDVACKILREFGLDSEMGHIVNGHVPVKVKKGERPVKGGGKLVVIDGGFAEAYQPKTGIAGYTLVYDSYGLLLATHPTFDSTQKAIEQELDVDCPIEILERNPVRMRVKNTDLGKQLTQQIKELQMLAHAYQSGLLQEKETTLPT